MGFFGFGFVVFTGVGVLVGLVDATLVGVLDGVGGGSVFVVRTGVGEGFVVEFGGVGSVFGVAVAGIVDGRAVGAPDVVVVGGVAVAWVAIVGVGLGFDEVGPVGVAPIVLRGAAMVLQGEATARTVGFAGGLTPIGIGFDRVAFAVGVKRLRSGTRVTVATGVAGGVVGAGVGTRAVAVGTTLLPGGDMGRISSSSLRIARIRAVSSDSGVTSSSGTSSPAPRPKSSVF